MIMNKRFITLGYLQTRNIPNLCQFYSLNVLRHIRKRPTSICYRKQFLAILAMWTTCLQLVDGDWITSHHLQAGRYLHTSWTTPSGDVVLVGGADEYQTTELVKTDGTTEVGTLTLKYRSK